MWSQSLGSNPGSSSYRDGARGELLVARMQMAEALRLLDRHSLSAAAASLDLAIHYLDRELCGG